MFRGKRSVEYNDETFKFAFDKVLSFEADYGGTDIFSPLNAVFKLPKHK